MIAGYFSKVRTAPGIPEKTPGVLKLFFQKHGKNLKNSILALNPGKLLEFNLRALSKSQNWPARPWQEQHFDNEIGFSQPFLLKNHLLRA